MAEKKKFLLRIDENLYADLEKWAADDLRSINAQIEYLLKDALRKSGRISIDTTGLNNRKLDLNNNSGQEN
ncbi:MAG: Arc family DNA-binding protein [Bacteroidota bacterium]|jgi:hypothetical protein